LKDSVSPNTLSSTDVPSNDKPFSHPTTRVLNTETAEFLLILKDFSNFSPTGSVTEPSALAPIILKFFVKNFRDMVIKVHTKKSFILLRAPYR
jgi:hypothetical protein